MKKEKKRERTHQLLQTVKKRGHDVFVEIGARRHGLGVVGSGLHGEQGEDEQRPRKVFPLGQVERVEVAFPPRDDDDAPGARSSARRGELQRSELWFHLGQQGEIQGSREFKRALTF